MKDQLLVVTRRQHRPSSSRLPPRSVSRPTPRIISGLVFVVGGRVLGERRHGCRQRYRRDWGLPRHLGLRRHAYRQRGDGGRCVVKIICVVLSVAGILLCRGSNG